MTDAYDFIEKERKGPEEINPVSTYTANENCAT